MKLDRRHAISALLCCAVAVAPGACGSTKAGPSASIDGDDSGTRVDAATRPDSTADASGSEASTDGGAGADGGATPPLCGQADSWSTKAREPSIAATGLDRFGSVSGDALTVAWATSAGAMFVATRTLATDPFGAPVQVGAATPIAPGDRIALGPSGNLLVAVASGRASLVAFERSSSGWGPRVPNDFSQLNAMTGQFSEPVLGADQLSLYFLFANGGNPQLVESRWNPTLRSWDPPSPFSNAELATTDPAHPRRPTGMSSDGRTLFFYDEVANTQRGAWRDTRTSAFNLFLDLSEREASPDHLCMTLYYRGTDAQGIGLFTAFAGK